ncbi:hypothetical protein [Burkholderia gladioli]|uniref:hypothetical protein n=1 Tax=Burkholderia gladioli TaxID=28095 RepID=UPI000B339CC0|nr:hypothetical protein [Burkholderia gladioli]
MYLSLQFRGQMACEYPDPDNGYDQAGDGRYDPGHSVAHAYTDEQAKSTEDEAGDRRES